MADSQRNLDHSDDASIEQFINFENFFEGAWAEPDGIPDSEIQAPNEPRLPTQSPRLELHQGQANSSEVVSSMSLNNNNEIAMADVSFESVGEPSQPAAHTGNQSLRQYEQPSGTDSPNAELVNIDSRIQEIDLILERRELQERRHTILQGLQGPQQAQASERPGLQILGTASGSRTQLNSQRVTSGGASQGSDLFPTGVAPFSNNWVDHSYYDMSISPSGNDSSQNAPVGTDFPYNVALTDPSNSGVVDLALRGSPHFEVLEQSSQAGIDLSNTDSVHLPNYMPARLPSSGPNDHCGTPGPVPGLGSDQTMMQSRLTESQRKDGLNLERVQHVSALSSSQHDRALHNSERSISNRKRLGSSQPTKAQRLSAIQRQFAKKSGLPEVSLGVMCFGEEPSSKRKRTSSQKRNKKEVEDAGGSCFLCRVLKKTCSGQRPCDTCRVYWQRRAYNSTSFMWTCDVQSKLYDIDIFSGPLEIPESEIDDPILRAFWEKFGYLSELVYYLEQNRAQVFRRFTTEDQDLALWKIVNLYIDTHSIVRWKRTLVYLVPELHREFAFIEKVYRFSCLAVLCVCDRMHTLFRDKGLAVIIGGLVFDEIKHLTKMEKPNPSAVDHVQLALKARLKVLCSRIFDDDKIAFKNMRKLPRSFHLMMMINRVPELSFCLPPACRGYADSNAKFLRGFLPFHVPNTPLDLPACLLRRSDSSHSYCDDRQTDGCCCGWAFDSIPPFFLSLFGHFAGSFARYVHSGQHKVSFGGGDLAFDPCQAMNAVLGGPWVDNSSLSRSMVVFGSILSISFLQLFIIIDGATKRDPDMAVNKDRLDRIAKYCRPQFFAHLLRSALTMYHEFWNTYRESVNAVAHHNFVAVLVYAWVRERQGSEMDEFIDGVFQILNSSISAETTKSDDPDLSSDEDGTQKDHEDLSDDANVSPDEASIADEV